LPLGPALLVSLALVLVRATGGTVLHSALLVYAMLIDQTRIQPEIVSLAVLLWGTFPSPDAKLVGRTHLGLGSPFKQRVIRPETPDKLVVRTMFLAL
jgi:hypothetical protein